VEELDKVLVNGDFGIWGELGGIGFGAYGGGGGLVCIHIVTEPVPVMDMRSLVP
jgi:hypothetical protein